MTGVCFALEETLRVMRFKFSVRLVWLRSAAKMLSSRDKLFLEDTLSTMESEIVSPARNSPIHLKEYRPTISAVLSHSRWTLDFKPAVTTGCAEYMEILVGDFGITIPYLGSQRV